MKTMMAFILLVVSIGTSAQDTAVLHIPKLEIGKNKKEVFRGKDSSMVLHIDTLVMKNKSQLVFFGKKDITLRVEHASIDGRGYIYGSDGKNNGSDFDIDMRFEKLDALHVLAGGHDANNNGSRTHPNGDGGDVVFVYDSLGIAPQTEDKNSPHYLQIDTRAGGYRGNAQTDLRNIYSLINMGSPGRPLGNLAQGQVYSGSPGTDGKSTIRASR